MSIVTPLEQIKVEHRPQEHCEGCPFGGPQCGSKGQVDAAIVVVAESPGTREARRREPLIGPAGGLFHENFPAGVPVYILNALECMPLPSKKTEENMLDGMLSCRQRLIDKIKAYPRKFIITMGNHATRSVLDDTSLKITKVRGQVYDSPLSEYGVMPIIHPAALMRGTGSYKQWKDDLAYALDRAEGIQSRKYIEYAYECVRNVDPAKRSEYVQNIFRFATSASCDIETTGFDHRHDKILQVGVTIDTTSTHSSFAPPTTTYVFFPEDLSMLAPYLSSPDIKWAWHNGKFDVKFFRQMGIQARVDDDTMLLSYCLNEEGGIHDLDQVAADALGAPMHKDMLKPYLKSKKTSYAAIPEDVLTDYLGKDGGKTGQAKGILAPRVQRDKHLNKLYHETLIPASEYLMQIEMHGAFIDQDQITRNEEYYDAQKEEHQAEIRRISNMPELNPGSPQQMKELLFKVMKFPDRSKGSTDAKTIDKLRRSNPHPIFDSLLGYRTAAKMNGTYCRGWRKHIHEDGRIHCTYKIHGTKTGRLSSAEPNMQNIPRLARVKSQVIAPEGYWLVECDLSQAELRILTELSRDPRLLNVYNSGEDLHSDLSEEMDPMYRELASSEVKADKEKAKEIRVSAKAVNFGIVYGISEFGLADNLHIAPTEARKRLDAWYKRYHVAADFIEFCRNTPIRNQVLTTCFGRKKRVGVVSRMNLNFLQNEAANFPSQSIASDITLTAGIRVWKQLQEWGCYIVNTVHDSIIFEVPMSGGLELLDKSISLVNHELEQVPIDYGLTSIPFVADADVGKAWGELEEYDKWLLKNKQNYVASREAIGR